MTIRSAPRRLALRQQDFINRPPSVFYRPKPNVWPRLARCRWIRAPRTRQSKHRPSSTVPIVDRSACSRIACPNERPRGFSLAVPSNGNISADDPPRRSRPAPGRRARRLQRRASWRFDRCKRSSQGIPQPGRVESEFGAAAEFNGETVFQHSRAKPAACGRLDRRPAELTPAES